jgi:hypothetical protein
MLEYASLRSGIGIPSWRGCLYYAQRFAIHPSIRRAAARMIAAGINLWLQRPAPTLSDAGAQALERMAHDGYGLLPDMLSPHQLDDILDYLGDKPLLLRDGSLANLAVAQVQTTIADVPLETVLNCPHVLELANSSILIGLARSYLGCMPTISTMGIRWSFPGSDDSVQTQHFHRDPDDWRFFKFFLYLSDVDSKSGPHIYVKGTHRQAGTLRVRRINLGDLKRRYGADAIISVTGPRGTSFVADTYGIHAGPVPISRPRLLLEVGYSILPVFALQYRPIPIAHGQALDPYVNRLLLR